MDIKSLLLLYVPGTCLFECPILTTAARIEKPNKAERPKKTTALRRTQTVCIIFDEIYPDGRQYVLVCNDDGDSSRKDEGMRVDWVSFLYTVVVLIDDGPRNSQRRDDGRANQTTGT